VSGLVVILTALDLEYEAVREKLIDPSVQSHQAGTRFEVGGLESSPGLVALALVGRGNHPAAVLTERAIAKFAPVAVLFVGVAGGRRADVALGDVVVATHVYAYHGGTSEDDGFKARPRVWEISHGPDQIARHVARGADWARELSPDRPAPDVWFGPIAAGEVVQDSTTSDQARVLREHYNDAVAVEMESAGVAQAAHLNQSLPVIVVRGISDRADGTKTATDGLNWQPKAAANAAAFAVALAKELVIELPGDPAPSPEENTRSAAVNQGTTTNIATGNARVGVQAGQVIGDIRIGPDPGAPTDLAAQLAEFREHLRQARSAGRLDEGTYRAAEAELDVATNSLPTESEPGKNKLMLALKRLRGLIADLTDLAAKLATIITAAKGLS
jgi:adenosylhomocysteine nucleosidase